MAEDNAIVSIGDIKKSFGVARKSAKGLNHANDSLQRNIQSCVILLGNYCDQNNIVTVDGASAAAKLTDLVSSALGSGAKEHLPTQLISRLESVVSMHVSTFKAELRRRRNNPN